MGTGPLAPEIKVAITGKDTGVNVAIAELRSQLTQLKATQDATAASATQMGAAEAGAGRNMLQTRESARLLGEETGIRLNRGLVSVMANSKILGPLLQTAFPVAAAIGFGEVIASFAEKFSTLIADTFIFTAEMKQLQATNVEANKEIAKSVEHTTALGKAFGLIGLKGSERSVVEIQQIGAEITKVQKQIDNFNDQRAAARMGILGTGGNAITLPADIDAKQGVAQSRLNELQQQQFNLEKEAMATSAEEQIAAAGKLRSQKETLARANLSAIRTSLQDELELYKATDAAKEQDNQTSFDRGLESLTDYFKNRKELAAAEAREEIATLQAQRNAESAAGAKAIAGFNREIATVRANATGIAGREQLAGLIASRDAAAIENRTKLADLDSKIAVQRVNAAGKQTALDREEETKRDELNKARLEFEQKIAAAQGKAFEAAEAGIEAEVQKMAITLRQAGLAPDQIDAKLAEYKAALEEQKSFKGLQGQGDDALAELANKREDIALTNTQFAGEQKIAALERQRLPELKQLAAAMIAMARASGDPGQIKAAEDFQRKITGIEISVRNAGVSMLDFKNKWQSALGSDLTTFLGSTINQVHGVGDAFAKLGQSVVGSLQQIVAQLLVTMLMTKLLKSSFGGMMGFSGGGLAGAPGGHAEGGLISGPGGPTSDMIPAMLSSGEFVVRAAAVQDFGLHNLAMINAGANIPGIRGLGGIPHFAQGGLVTAGRASDGIDVRMGIGLDEGLILRYLTSPKAGRIVLQHLTNNPKAAQKALSRGE
jgi:hypothetical protein